MRRSCRTIDGDDDDEASGDSGGGCGGECARARDGDKPDADPKPASSICAHAHSRPLFTTDHQMARISNVVTTTTTRRQTSRPRRRTPLLTTRSTRPRLVQRRRDTRAEAEETKKNLKCYRSSRCARARRLSRAIVGRTIAIVGILHQHATAAVKKRTHTQSG